MNRRSFLASSLLTPLAAWLSSRVSAAPVLPADATGADLGVLPYDAVTQRKVDALRWGRFDRATFDRNDRDLRDVCEYDLTPERQRYVDVFTHGYRGEPSHKLLVLTPSHATDPAIGAVMFYREDGTVWTGVHVELNANGPPAGVCTHVAAYDTLAEAQAAFAARHMLRNDAVRITEDGCVARGQMVGRPRSSSEVRAAREGETPIGTVVEAPSLAEWDCPRCRYGVVTAASGREFCGECNDGENYDDERGIHVYSEPLDELAWPPSPAETRRMMGDRYVGRVSVGGAPRGSCWVLVNDPFGARALLKLRDTSRIVTDADVNRDVYAYDDGTVSIDMG